MKVKKCVSDLSSIGGFLLKNMDCPISHALATIKVCVKEAASIVKTKL